MIYDLRLMIGKGSRLAVILLTCSLSHFLTCPAHAATEITAVLWLTNNPAGLSSNLTVNIGAADTRYPTNDVTGVETTHWMVTNTIAWARSNLFAHLSAYPVYSAGAGTPQLGVGYSSTNTAALELTAPLNTNITVTVGAGWASVTYFTNTFADSSPIQSQTNAMSHRVRTNAVQSMVNLLSTHPATNAIPTNTPALRNYADNQTPQTLSNKTLFKGEFLYGRITGTTNLTGTNFTLTTGTLAVVTITGGTYSGIISALTNGSLYTNFIAFSTLTNPIALNLINYGNAIRSEGPGGNSLQVGSNAVALGTRAVAMGNSAIATNTDAIAIGTGATATNTSALALGSSASANGSQALAIGGGGAGARGSGATAIGGGALSIADGGTTLGNGAAASGTNAIAIGTESIAAMNRSIALGFEATSDHLDSMAIGNSTQTTTTNQIRIGTATEHISIPGRAEITGNLDASGKAQFGTATNNTWTGTNVLNGRIDLTARANSGLANGYNSGVIFGTNAYIRFSGPSGAYTNVGFAAPGGPQRVIGQFSNPGLSFTLLDESGLEATAANRILTGTGALLNSTNNPVVVDFLYDDAAARWRVLSFR